MQVHPSLQEVGVVQPLTCNVFNVQQHQESRKSLGRQVPLLYPKCNGLQPDLHGGDIGHLLLKYKTRLLATDQIVGKQ